MFSLVAACVAQSTITAIAPSAFVKDISRNGQYVVGNRQDNTPFLWSSGSGFVAGLPQMATAAVSDNGVVAGSNGHACVWSSSAGLTDLGVLPGETASTATGISADGSVVVGTSGYSVFRWTKQSGLVLIASRQKNGNTVTVAGQCSADGSVVVGGLNGSPFIWTSGSGVTSPLPWSGFFVHVNRDGSRVSGDVTDPFFHEGVMLGPAFTTYIGSSSFPTTSVFNICDDGSFGLANATTQTGTVSYLWTREAGLTKLQDYLVANGASAAGNFKSIRAAVLAVDGNAAGAVARDNNGVDNAVYITLPSPSSTKSLLDNVFFSPNTRVGSNNVDIVARLTGAAPSGGAKLPLQPSSQNLIPRSTALVGGKGIYVPAGATQAVNYATTTAVNARGDVYVRGTYLGESRIATLQLNPATLYDPTLSSPIATGGSTVTCNLMLNGLAASTATIALSSSDPAAASVPSTATIAAGGNKTTFSVQTHSVLVPQTVTISVTYRGITKTVSLTVVP